MGQLKIQAPRVDDRRVDEQGRRFRFTSEILPPYLRRTKSVEELIPWLYLKGIPTGDFSEALEALLGPDAAGLSATTVVRLKEVWRGEYQAWSKRDLSGQRFVYLWADGIYSNVRLDDERQCLLVVIGALEASALRKQTGLLLHLGQAPQLVAMKLGCGPRSSARCDAAAPRPGLLMPRLPCYESRPAEKGGQNRTFFTARFRAALGFDPGRVASGRLVAMKTARFPVPSPLPVGLSSPSLALERLPASHQDPLPARFKTHRLGASSEGCLQIVISQATNSRARRGSSCWVACDMTPELCTAGCN